MKKLIFLLIILSTLISHKIINSNNLNIEIIYKLDSEFMYVNGVKKEIDPKRGTKPILIKEWGRVLLPIRSLIETLGCKVDWDPISKSITLTFPGV